MRSPRATRSPRAMRTSTAGASLAIRAVRRTSAVSSASSLRRGGLLAASRSALAASEAPTASGSLFDQHAAFLECQSLRITILRNLRVLLAIGDVRPIAAVQHLNSVYTEIDDGAI